MREALEPMSVAHDVCAHASTVYPAHVDFPSLDFQPGSSGTPVDTVGLRKVSKARAGDSGGLSMTDAALRKVRAGAHTSRP